MLEYPRVERNIDRRLNLFLQPHRCLEALRYLMHNFLGLQRVQVHLVFAAHLKPQNGHEEVQSRLEFRNL